MTARKFTSKPDATISDILEINTGEFECCILGTSPIILNRMSQKVWHELLMPKGRKTATEKATTLKHDPIAEYQASPYILKDEREPTYLAHLATAFKQALSGVARDMPGAKKAQIGRLTWVVGEYVGIYGVPRLYMRPARSADMNHTPDIRTRAIVGEWACRLQVRFVKPLIRPQAIANLLAAAGVIRGVGDWRPEKGSGNHGQFRLVDQDDPDFLRVVSAGGRSAQIAAWEMPIAYDDQTAEMLGWFSDELRTRKLKGVA